MCLENFKDIIACPQSILKISPLLEFMHMAHRMCHCFDDSYTVFHFKANTCLSFNEGEQYNAFKTFGILWFKMANICSQEKCTTLPSSCGKPQMRGWQVAGTSTVWLNGCSLCNREIHRDRVSCVHIVLSDCEGRAPFSPGQHSSVDFSRGKNKQHSGLLSEFHFSFINVKLGYYAVLKFNFLNTLRWGRGCYFQDSPMNLRSYILILVPIQVWVKIRTLQFNSLSPQ